MDRPTIPLPRNRNQLWLGLAAGAALGAIATALVATRAGGDDAPIQPPAEIATAAPVPDASSTGQGEELIEPTQVEEDGYEIHPQRLAYAFRAATGRSSPFITRNGAEWVRTKPLQIVELPFGTALLTEDTNQDTHASSGAIGVHYLEEEEDGYFRVTGSWPRAVQGWDWGDPPEWRFTNKFTANPAIYAWGDFMAQGIVTRGATLVELTPDGPIESELISTGFDDEGHVESNPCKVEGRIANIRRDRSFDVIVSGSRTAIERFEKKGGRFVVEHKIDWEDPCGYPRAHE